ncbi:hypothetical protein AMAG_09997 [Allomyces macrogynus ATCC 38327]|uniref:NOT2/NOT3/NOT5 C-terminal domain-containing protein n=1 Tax=Allomyces macrogynus (strain ATCC 38327) TaxID=578462 RepID=A0A0L0SQL1_ALLM3|nr:hypothetical protein AMAG_09997 [Allomyces macrogynus ATCC 38327]|eukprot:KNE64640.1 hypothetical protein AMAG_09997 [Allomyces macrogynus ATCC 38327]
MAAALAAAAAAARGMPPPPPPPGGLGFPPPTSDDYAALAAAAAAANAGMPGGWAAAAHHHPQFAAAVAAAAAAHGNLMNVRGGLPLLPQGQHVDKLFAGGAKPLGPGGLPPALGGVMGVPGAGMVPPMVGLQNRTSSVPPPPPIGPGSASTAPGAPGPASDGTVAAPAAAAAGTPALPSTDKYGLLGLLGIIRLTDPDTNALALGTDLTTLGLNLNSPELLYPMFASPFSETLHPLGAALQGPVEPEFHLPSCYLLPFGDASSNTNDLPGGLSVQDLAAKVVHFSDETLFYIFYAMPRDQVQDLAAAELYARHWRYHKDLQLWLTKDTSADAMAVAAATGVKTATYERGLFIFFDVTTFEKRSKEFTLYYDALEERPPGGAVAAAAAMAAAKPAQASAAALGLPGLAANAAALHMLAFNAPANPPPAVPTPASAVPHPGVPAPGIPPALLYQQAQAQVQQQQPPMGAPQPAALAHLATLRAAASQTPLGLQQQLQGPQQHLGGYYGAQQQQQPQQPFSFPLADAATAGRPDQQMLLARLQQQAAAAAAAQQMR